MKNKFNILRKYILDNSQKKYRKETVNGLFRSIIEPLLSNQKIEACILLRLNDIKEKESLLKRLSFINSNIYSYNDKLSIFNIENIQTYNIWDTTEFAVILGQRYSAALIWDYNLSEKPDYTDVCFLHNSKIISDIAKKIAENSNIDLKEFIQKYSPDRRENTVLNQSITAIANLLNEKTEEFIFNEQEKKNIISSDDTLKTAETVAQKAKFIAHEIKNNLSIVNLYSTITEKRIENVKAEEDVILSIQNAMKNIMSASENISYLIGDLRCLSAPYMTEFNVRNAVLNTVMMCELKAKNADVVISVNNFDDFVITTDKTKFQCALTNIIFNAIEACKPSCKIQIDCLKENESIKVFVKNNGEIIPKDIQKKIFDPDFTTKPKGSGLGLNICSKQLAMIGGKIELLSSTEFETVFMILLHIEDAEKTKK